MSGRRIAKITWSWLGVLDSLLGKEGKGTQRLRCILLGAKLPWSTTLEKNNQL